MQLFSKPATVGITFAVVLGTGALVPLGIAGATSESAMTYSLDARQVQEVTVAVEFVRAFNARKLAAASALMSSNVAVSDCDYDHMRAVQFHGTASATKWLRGRFRDRDHLAIGRVYNDNQDDPTGAVGIEFARRTSLTLRRLGFPSGIAPKGATKVLFTSGSATRIRAFSLGPVGGSADLCRPGP